MNNDLIGISGVLIITLLLFVVRHLYLSIGRRDRNDYVTATPPQRREPSETVESDSWIWTPEK